MKIELFDTALSSYESFSCNQNPSENLTTSKFKDFRDLSKEIFSLKSRPGNTIVILGKTSYSKAIEEILNDDTKLSNLDIPVGHDINYMTNLAKRITSDLKLLKMKKLLKRLLIRTTDYLSLDEVLIRVTKVHREAKNGLPPFRPILSAIGTPNYNLEKLIPFLKPLPEKNTSPQTYFILLKIYVNETLIHIWLLYMLIFHLLIFHWTKPLIFVLIIWIMIMRIALKILYV